MRTKLISVCLLVFLCFCAFVCACGSDTGSENTGADMKTNISDESAQSGSESKSAYGDGASNQSDIDNQPDETGQVEIDTVTGSNAPSDTLSGSDSDASDSVSSSAGENNTGSDITTSSSGSDTFQASDSSGTSSGGNDTTTASSGNSSSDKSKNSESTTNTNTSNGEPIDIIFVCGQSNAAGMTDQPSGYGTARAQSIACDADQIYSSYVPLDDAGANISGISDIGSYVTRNNVSAYISNSVGSTTSLAGTTLAYPPYALSVNGNGKTGMDSAIAYEWNQLTGRKVWIVNSSYSGSAISTWTPGQTNYEATAEAMHDVIQVVNNDSDYQVGRIRMIWLQGESDTFTDQKTYESTFTSMLNGFESTANGMKTGIVIPRAMGGDSKPFDNNNAANALRNIAASRSDVAVVCDTHLQWTDDNAVRDYFAAAYPNGITYPTHSGLPIMVPTTYAETYVHPHFTQIGHNENGLISARNLYSDFG